MAPRYFNLSFGRRLAIAESVESHGLLLSILPENKSREHAPCVVPEIAGLAGSVSASRLLTGYTCDGRWTLAPSLGPIRIVALFMKGSIRIDKVQLWDVETGVEGEDGPF